MKTLRVFVLMTLVQSVSGCDRLSSAPSPLPPPPTPVSLRVFTDMASGFSTSDLRDAQDQIVRINSANELIWTPDGTRFPGFTAPAAPRASYIAAEHVCACWLEVSFGIADGERRAYLTADYGHDNPGSIVDLEVVNGALIVTRSHLYPPGTYTLSGIVMEETATGTVPVEGATVYRGYETGSQEATTDRAGLYKIQGLYDRVDRVSVVKDGYQTVSTQLAIASDTRFDIRLVRR